MAGELELNDIRLLAKANGFHPSERILMAIVNASKTHKIPAKELTAIGILESGLGKYSRKNPNSNGTKDIGVFQINTVNAPYCIEYNLHSIEGNALCAAKLLKNIAKKHNDYLGRYHSKTPSKKKSYHKAALRVLGVKEIINVK